MIIECPQCQETYETDHESMPPEGIEFHCKNCRLTFRIKSHLEPEEQEPHTLSTPDILLQREEIPFWMVQTYQQGEHRTAPQDNEPRETILLQNLHEANASHEESIPILMDEPAVEEDAALGESMLGSPYADHRGFHRDFPTHAPRTRRRIRPGFIIGTAFILALIAFFLFGGDLKQDALRIAKNLTTIIEKLLPFQESDEGSLQFSNLNSDFVPRGNDKPAAFVIQGKVTNKYPRACQSIRVRGILFDERGKRAAEETVYCGNILKKDDIRSLTSKKIDEMLQNAYGASLSNLNVEPGASIPFMLVFFHPPEQLSEFSVEVADYTLKEQEPQGGENP